ncbi:hypothetical protein P154DRAFT_617201 [Amniculicola lignicola CBS 123094]|uniref:Nucleolar 27S pre-rRNA processing Urb2/Npa2 C-terminal domain-containing protein n=1 Tax=Amniculicola lignicola CBS 123094 TaxID=1392246 RepID=A0A6A5WZ30_9PLEO|nr:hypothetical protein P154DRAFT_617201 [Amniculicola lignicola CBS 123094]
MASLSPSPASALAPTLPRLLALSKDFTDVDEQIRQAAHITGLPKCWSGASETKTHANATPSLVGARTEWALRWILEKLKDEDSTGQQAHSNPRSWIFLYWMVESLPVSRSAGHFKNADFLGILERALQENFGREVATQAVDVPRDNSESSETVQEELKPSRKRKRQSAGNTSPSKKVALESSDRNQLFAAILLVLKAIISKASSLGNAGEPLKATLRTGSDQASRILKFWLIATNNLLGANLGIPTPLLQISDGYLGLSLVLEVWECRTKEAEDAASVEQFSTECLLSVLTLHDKLQCSMDQTAPRKMLASSVYNAKRCLELLLARHLILPSKAAFLTEPSETVKTDSLACYLGPLRAKIEQAAEIQDSSEQLPEYFSCLLRAIPRLLEMSIRSLSSHTTKGRLAAKPWIQAVFLCLTECAGCPCEAPKFAVHGPSITILIKLLDILKVYGIPIDSNILQDLFWYHSGINYPSNEGKTVHWPLIAALVDLDSNVFLPKGGSKIVEVDGRPEDFSTFIFDRISAARLEKVSSQSIERFMPLGSGYQLRDTVVQGIIVPLMSAFARNRDLIGFIQRWDAQLCKIAQKARDPLKETVRPIWDEIRVRSALAGLFERSLTHAQIVDMFKYHTTRTNRLASVQEPDATDPAVPDNYRKVWSSVVVLNTLLSAVDADETKAQLEPLLVSLLGTLSSIAGENNRRVYLNLDIYWKIICQLLTHLWPLYLHGSLELQKSLLLPVLQQATGDVGATRKEQRSSPIDSPTRAAALTFLFVACDHLSEVPGWGDDIRKSLRTALKCLTSNRLQSEDLAFTLEIFCSEYPQLLQHYQPEKFEKTLLGLLSTISELDGETPATNISALSEFLFTKPSSSIRDAYASVVLSAIDQAYEDEQKSVVVMKALSIIHPEAMTRDHREAVLNKLTEKLNSSPREVDQLLEVMFHLMNSPNASARVASDGDTFFSIAQSLHNANFESPGTTKLFQQLIERTLEHILQNKDQARNMRYLETFKLKLAHLIKKSARCTPARLALLRAVANVQKDANLIRWDKYLRLLATSLNEKTTRAEHILEAFNNIPSSVLRTHGDVFTLAQASLRTWMEPVFDINESIYLKDGSEIPDVMLLQLHAVVTRFRLYPSTKLFVQLSLNILRQELPEQEYLGILEPVRDTLSSLTQSEKLDLVPVLLQPGDDNDHGASYRFLHVLISNLENVQADGTEQKKQQLSILPELCKRLATTTDSVVFGVLLDSIDTMLCEKSSFTSQYSIEAVLATLIRLTSSTCPQFFSASSPTVYSRLCKTTHWILLLNRGRLGGRYQVFLPLLQNLLFCLFIPNAGRGQSLPSWLKSTVSDNVTPLTPRNAKDLANLFNLLASPPLSTLTRSHHHRGSNNSRSLNDPSRAAKETLSHFVYPLLASFARFQLSGHLDPQVRDKLMPGIWSIMGVGTMDKESLDSMFSGMGREGRDIWRGVWSEYVRVGGGRARGREGF